MSACTSDPKFDRRYKIEEILEVGCPRCDRAPHEFCDRAGERLHRAGAALRSQGIPPSHQERMWLRQGHDPADFDRLRSGVRPFAPAGTSERVSGVACAQPVKPVTRECLCGLPPMPVAGVNAAGVDFRGWSCSVWKCSYLKVTA